MNETISEMECEDMTPTLINEGIVDSEKKKR